MAHKQDVLTLIGAHMQRPFGNPTPRPDEMPAISDLIRRIDRALTERRAA